MKMTVILTKAALWVEGAGKQNKKQKANEGKSEDKDDVLSLDSSLYPRIAI